MALIDEWRSQREQRQTQTRGRSEAVQIHIKNLTDQRQAAAVQLQEQLRQFRSDLGQAEKERRFQGEQQQANLQAYTQELREQIEDFLETCTTERFLMSDEVATRLQETMERLQTETQTFLQTARQTRKQRYDQLQEDLAEYIEDLHLQMESYRQILEQKRQERIVEIEERQKAVKKTLSSTCQQRQENAQVLQLELDSFIHSLKEYRQNLYQWVWGDTPVAIPAPSAPKPAFKSKPSKAAKKPTPTPKPALVAPKPAPATLPTPSPAPVPEAATGDKKNGKNLSTEEEQVYNFLRKSPSSRLTAIEEALGINRVQAVDTLRSLIKKGMVTQRDRLYSVL
ncbi:helix-turn-helix domain-containing protein [Roseofilum sp. BLCC_M154]|uniref:Helix-turn-helix domain-containing protein n=1 Tax=Roseofilum acuticapitatum BLCC-M154 TaxID=3022444 RepID=A0ABT7AST3_9CYAN|nr:helix-turn-helix domain-containing protein [Roseofilum acuticapitatum]MDJ1169356.1 helix-turn-helix domain-containing protein [Roseofilum acuticapitatum BLCC-M154]